VWALVTAFASAELDPTGPEWPAGGAGLRDLDAGLLAVDEVLEHPDEPLDQVDAGRQLDRDAVRAGDDLDLASAPVGLDVR